MSIQGMSANKIWLPQLKEKRKTFWGKNLVLANQKKNDFWAFQIY